jgi:hypothetical protein
MLGQEKRSGATPGEFYVWADCCNPFKNKRVFSSVVATLVRKVLVKITGKDFAARLALTQEGRDALKQDGSNAVDNGR